MLKPETLINDIRRNLDQVNDRIHRAAVSAGRDSDRVTLVVVSKGKDIATVQAATQAGIREFGENYPEHAAEKIEALKETPDICWHMIGHLQSRKSNLVVEHFNYMHSLDSLKLAQRLDQQLKDAHKTLPVLLEFNVAGESSKHGWNAQKESEWSALLPDLEAFLALSSLRVKGLMCMPPFSEDPENSRSYYVKVCKLRDFFASRYPDLSWNELSMGTSFDYEVAIQEGATFVRVGQAILGPRP